MTSAFLRRDPVRSASLFHETRKRYRAERLRVGRYTRGGNPAAAIVIAQSRHLHGKIPDGGGFGRPAMYFEAGSLRRQAVQELIACAAAHDEQPLQPLAGGFRYRLENLGVAP